MGYTDMKFANKIADAILAGDKKMLLEDGSVLDIPNGQGQGTDYQKQSYANMKAIKIVEELNQKKYGTSSNK